MSVRIMAPEDEARAIDTIALAFAADPMSRWVWPEAHQYLSVIQRVIRAFGGAAFRHDGAFCSGDFTGVALWLAPGVSSDEKQLAQLMDTSGSRAAREGMTAIFEQMAKYHPKGPQWYLPLIGVDPAQQGKGHGDALMRHALERVDHDKIPAYLESSNPRNIPLYRRHGFEEIGEIQAGSSPTIVPMLRRAR
jgi:GNAT superfamily N-acetyltransferase